MKETDKEEVNFFENRRIFDVRSHLKLGQDAFGKAISMTQSGISALELYKNGVTRKIKTRLKEVFFVDPLYFEEGSGAAMFLGGKEREALAVAEKLRKKRSGTAEEIGEEVRQSSELQSIRIERLSTELEMTKDLLESREELLKSRDEMILLLKSQLAGMDSKYENLSRELSELRKVVDQGIIDRLEVIKGKIYSGESPDPNGLNPAKSSG